MHSHKVLIIDASTADDIAICLQDIGVSNFSFKQKFESGLLIDELDLLILDIDCADHFFETYSPAQNGTPSIVLVGNNESRQEAYRYLERHVDDILIRPFDQLEARNRLAKLFNKQPSISVLPPVEDLKKYRKFIDLSADIILTVTNGIITFHNKKAETSLATPRRELLGCRLSQVAHVDFAEIIEELLPELAETGAKLPVQLKGQDNRTIHALLSVSSIPEECQNTYLLQASDHEEQKNTLEGLLQRERLYRHLVEMSSNLVMIVRDGVIAFSNPACEARLNDTLRDTNLIGRPLSSIVSTDYIQIIDAALEDLAQQNERLPMRLHSLGGKTFDVELHVVHLDSEISDTYLIEAIDISKQKRDAEALLEREERLAGIVDNAPDAIISMNGQGHIESFNNSAVKIFGYSAEEACQKNLFDFVQIAPQQAPKSGLNECTTMEAVGIRKNGRKIDIDLSIKSMHFGDKQKFIAIIRDVTAQKRDHEELAFLATHDPLTKLPNSHFLLKTLERITKTPTPDFKCTVLFITLERLNRVNDLFGHQMVDHVLSAVAQRLNDSIGNENIVGRWGGGKFVAIIPNLPHDIITETICDDLIKALGSPFYIEDNEIIIGCKIGISCYPDDCENPANLVKNAGMAAFAARQEEHTTYLFYSKEMEAEAEERDMLERELRLALAAEQLQVYYQPKIDLSTGNVRGMEALIRWIHPELGFISPAKFIPIAEETGQIVSIGEWVLKKACLDTKNWLDTGHHHLKVAVNLSGRQFDEDKLLATVKDVLNETGLPPINLELEVTESSLMRDIDQGMRILKDLRDLGITTAIDDFGTGYSSLSYLRRIPLDTLKIDQSFVRNLHTDPDDAAIARTIMDMADNLGLMVVAEGIEIEAHETFLQSIKCHIGQGYYYSKPIPATEFDNFLKTYEPPESLLNRRSGDERRVGMERRLAF